MFERIKNDMIMNVSPVRMCCHQKRMFPFGKPQSQFIAYLIGFFRCNLPRLKRLPDLISNHIALLPPAGDMPILALRKKKFFIGSHRIALISRNQIAFFCFLRILRIVGPISQALGNRPAFIDMKSN